MCLNKFKQINKDMKEVRRLKNSFGLSYAKVYQRFFCIYKIMVSCCFYQNVHWVKAKNQNLSKNKKLVDC